MPTLRTIPRHRGLTTRDYFLALAQKFANLARREGLQLVPYSSTYVPHFAALSEAEQENVICKIYSLVDICQRLQSQKKSAGDARALTSEYLNSIDVQAPEGLIEAIDPEDSVDIYTPQHQMIFATLAYFRSFSYSLEELFCRPWTDLYASDTPYVREKYLELAQRLVSGREKGVIKIDSIPNHVAFEQLRPAKLAIVAIPKVATPLFNAGGQIDGYLLVHTLTPLGRSI